MFKKIKHSFQEYLNFIEFRKDLYRLEYLFKNESALYFVSFAIFIIHTLFTYYGENNIYWVIGGISLPLILMFSLVQFLPCKNKITFKFIEIIVFTSSLTIFAISILYIVLKFILLDSDKFIALVEQLFYLSILILGIKFVKDILKILPEILVNILIVTPITLFLYYWGYDGINQLVNNITYIVIGNGYVMTLLLFYLLLYAIHIFASVIFMILLGAGIYRISIRDDYQYILISLVFLFLMFVINQFFFSKYTNFQEDFTNKEIPQLVYDYNFYNKDHNCNYQLDENQKIHYLGENKAILATEKIKDIEYIFKPITCTNGKN